MGLLATSPSRRLRTPPSHDALKSSFMTASLADPIGKTADLAVFRRRREA